MNLEYKVSGHYFEKGKKGFYKGKINLCQDNKIIGLLEDLDYKDQGKRFILGFYEKDPITNIKFIKVPQIKEENKVTFIYSLTNEKLNATNFEGTYKGFWIGIEPYFDGKLSRLLKIPKMPDGLKEIFRKESTEEILAELENIPSALLISLYFNNNILKNLDDIPVWVKQKAELTISKF